MANATPTVAALWVLTSFGLFLDDLNRSAIKDGTSSDNLTRQGQRIIRRDRPIIGDAVEKIAIHLVDRRIVGVARRTALAATSAHTP